MSPDTIVPGAANPQALNRYSYVLGNPLRYTDPTGHTQESDDYTESDGQCSAGDTSCNWVGDGNDNNNDNNDEDDGGGDKPLLAPSLNTDTHYDLPPLPPHPGECEWTDCILSAASFFASAFTFAPPVAPIAFAVDVVGTIWSINRTDRDYHQGKISQTRQRALNITGIIGVIPAAPETGIGIITGVIGIGASFLNLLMTFTGIPQ